MSVHPALAETVCETHLLPIANWIGRHLAIGCDAISLAFFLSRAAARLGVPFNLVVCTDVPAALRFIIDRLLQCGPPGAKRADRIAESRKFLTSGHDNLDVILLGSLHRQLLGFSLEAVSRDARGAEHVPAVWWIGDRAPDCAVSGPTLQLITTGNEHCLTGFGHHFSSTAADFTSPDRVTPKAALDHLVENLAHCPRFEVPFQKSIRARLRPDEMLVANRLMRAIAALRLSASEQTNGVVNVCLEDFGLARAILTQLPVAALHDRVPPYTIETAAAIWQRVSPPDYQCTVPDRSEIGHKAFSRRDVIQWTGLSYNAVKEHLSALEGSGIIEATVRAADRKQGRQVFYAFASAASPPFHRRNPYTNLPTVEQIAANCSPTAQS